MLGRCLEIVEPPRKFTCLMCGDCCRASPISLLPHEQLIIIRLAKKLGVKVDFTRGYTVYDKLNNVNIVLTYHMQLTEKGVCPFLRDDNKCKVHRLYKPLICRSFPYTIKNVSYFFDPITRTAFHRSEYTISGACKFIREHAGRLEFYLGNEAFVRKFFEDEVRAGYLMEKYRSMYMAALTYLWKMNYVDLASKEHKGAIYVNAYVFIRKFIPYFAIAPS